MSSLAFESAMRHAVASFSGRDLGSKRAVGSSHVVSQVTVDRRRWQKSARFLRNRRRHASCTPCAERYAVSTEDAQAMFNERFSPGSVPVELRETDCGRGLVALHPIKEGDLLLSMDWKHTVHVFEDGYDDPDDLRLALELLRVLNHERDEQEDKDGNTDSGYLEKVEVWARYRPMLPSSTGAAAFWRSENIKELQHDDAVEETTRLAMGFEAHAIRHADSSYESGYQKSDILWALSLVHSRSFSVVTPTGTARALVPFADLFNHHPESPAQARETDRILQKALRDTSESNGENNSEVCMSTSNGSEPWCVNWDASTNQGTFEMRSIWAYKTDEEVFITYGHETSAELLASYGFFPSPNAGDFVRLYTDVQDVLDDDRYVQRDSAGLAMQREAVMWSALAVEAPLAVRPGGISNAAHLLGCLRLMHAHGSTLGTLRDEDVPHIGHSTFVWTGDEPCGLWGEVKESEKVDELAADKKTAVAIAERLEESGLESERVAVDRAALGQASARCVEILAEFPTSLEEDLGILEELNEKKEIKDDDDEESEISLEQYQVAVSYRATVKRMLHDFVQECAAMGVEPSEW